MKNAHRLATFVKPERYKILFTPDLIKFTFLGEESIFITLEKPTKEITLHCTEIEIESVEFVGKKEKFVGKVKYNPKAETATFVFPKIIAKGKGELKIKFKGNLNDKMRGFYRSKFTHNGEEKHLATTQFESTDARRAFPSFDEPAHKAIFEVSLIIPKYMTAISNTIETQITEHNAELKLVEFEPTPKMSTYILAFLVGEFEYVQGRSKDGVLVRVFTTPGKKQQAKFALNVGIKCLEFYNQYFGINYPLPVLDMIAIPDFAAGAMENWGAVTYRESTLLIDEQMSSTANKQWVALVIAHELAHMWFGDLVTMEWWTHLWLNEGFASFIEYLAIDHIFPNWDIWTQFVATEEGVAYSLDSLQNTHPIEVEVMHPAEISEIFDRVSYSKGASVLRMLHEYLGPKAFQEGLQFYLKKHAYGNTQTEDLWKALEKTSKKPVSKVMKNWTLKSGHPVVTVVESKNVLKLTQSRFFSSPISKKKTKDNTVWSIPIKIQDAETKTQDLLMDKKLINIDKPKDGGWIKLNMGESSLFRVDYPQNLLRALEEAVKLKQIPSVDRLGLIRDSFALSQSGQTPTTLALELALNYIDEDDYTVWAEISSNLSQLDSLLANESYYPEFQKYTQKLYQKIALKLGWKAKKGEKHTDGLLRNIVLNKLGRSGDVETIKKAQELFKNPLKVDPDIKGVVYNLVAANGGTKEFEGLIKMYKREENQQERERIGRSLGLFKSKTILKEVLEFAISKHVRFQNALGIVSSVWGNPEGRYLAWDFIKKNFKLLKERYAGGHYFTRVFTGAGEFTKSEDAKDIISFIKKNPTPEANRTIAQVLEQIYSNVEWLKRDKEKIRDFLKAKI